MTINAQELIEGIEEKKSLPSRSGPKASNNLWKWTTTHSRGTRYW